MKYMPLSTRRFGSEHLFSDFCPVEASNNEYSTFGNVAWCVGAMQRARVEILAGSDTPNPYVFPGFSLHDELALLVEAGLTPMQALRAATSNPAKFLGMSDSLGTIEKGKLADLVLLDANPLDDIRHTQRIHGVVANGRYFPPKNRDVYLPRRKQRRKAIDWWLLSVLIGSNEYRSYIRFRSFKRSPLSVLSLKICIPSLAGVNSAHQTYRDALGFSA